MSGRRTPEERAKSGAQSVRKIRRKYKKNLNVKKTFALGEREFAKEMTVVLKLAGYSNAQIGGVVGVSRGQVREMLEEPDVAEKLAELRENLPGAAIELLHGYSIEAVQTILAVMRESKNDKLVLQAAGEILDRAGIGKVSKSEAHQHRTNENRTTIGADEGMMEALRKLPPEEQEEAAVMIESLENFLKEKGEETE